MSGHLKRDSIQMIITDGENSQSFSFHRILFGILFFSSEQFVGKKLYSSNAPSTQISCHSLVEKDQYNHSFAFSLTEMHGSFRFILL